MVVAFVVSYPSQRAHFWIAGSPVRPTGMGDPLQISTWVEDWVVQPIGCWSCCASSGTVRYWNSQNNSLGNCRCWPMNFYKYPIHKYLQKHMQAHCHIYWNQAHVHHNREFVLYIVVYEHTVFVSATRAFLDHLATTNCLPWFKALTWFHTIIIERNTQIVNFWSHEWSDHISGEYNLLF